MFEPIIVPGYKTLLQPISTLSPRKAPTLFKLVLSIISPFISILDLSLFWLAVITPAPRWDLYPIIESPI